jgi:hypothetical protein
MILMYKLLPEQVMAYWDDIKACIMAALPPYVGSNPDAITYIQEQLLVGTIECWAAFEEKKLCGVMTTQVIHDPISRTRNLLIYSITIVSGHSDELWQLAAEKMRAYATARKCNNIIAYSNNDQMIYIAEKLGADSSYRLLTFSL